MIKGYKEKWMKDFKFDENKSFKKNPKFKTKDEWILYGLENKFNERNPLSLEESKNKKERSWYHSGAYKRWLRDF